MTECCPKHSNRLIREYLFPELQIARAVSVPSKALYMPRQNNCDARGLLLPHTDTARADREEHIQKRTKHTCFSMAEQSVPSAIMISLMMIIPIVVIFWLQRLGTVYICSQCRRAAGEHSELSRRSFIVRFVLDSSVRCGKSLSRFRIWFKEKSKRLGKCSRVRTSQTL